VNSLPETVTRQRCDCDLNAGLSAPESSTLTARLPSHPSDCRAAYKTVWSDISAAVWLSPAGSRCCSHFPAATNPFSDPFFAAVSSARTRRIVSRRGWSSASGRQHHPHGSSPSSGRTSSTPLAFCCSELAASPAFSRSLPSSAAGGQASANWSSSRASL